MLKMLFEIRDVLKSFDLEKAYVSVKEDSRTKANLVFWIGIEHAFVSIGCEKIRFSITDFELKGVDFEFPIEKFSKDLFYKLIENAIENYNLING